MEPAPVADGARMTPQRSLADRGSAISWAAIALCVALLAAALGMPIHLMARKSISSDEQAHIASGLSYLKTREIILNPMHPPLIKEIAALPLLFLGVELPADGETIARNRGNVFYQWQFADDFLSRVDIPRILFWARIPATLLSLALAALILRWSTGPSGIGGGLVSVLCWS